ncbi:MAG: type II toxin-antitoxin system HicB family antitoxin [Lachnospiraceae bacterium]|nr:type II toxin-antitoxin system HicB family antitoxin [Lachnospiraceae bacterium]
MKKVYPVIFTQLDDKKETVLVEVPDWGILTEGYGMADAMYMARDAIGLNGIDYEDDGKDIPEPSELNAIDVSKGIFADDGESFVSLVDIDFVEYRRRADNRTVRRNVTIPSWLNQEAEKAHINVSRVLQEALMTKLNVSR